MTEEASSSSTTTTRTISAPRVFASPESSAMRITPSVQVFVVTAPAHEIYRNRFLANAAGWHREFPDLQIYTFDEVPTNVTSLLGYATRIHQIQLQSFEKNGQRNNLLLASFAAIYQHNPNADWYFLAEDDTVVVKQNLDQVVARLSFKRDIYMGKCVTARPSKRFGFLYFIMGGSGVLISGNLLSKMAPGIDGCRKSLAKYQHGDTRISACLKEMNIMPDKICALPETKGYKFTSASPWWESSLSRNQGHLVVTMHEKEPDRIRVLNDAVRELGSLKEVVSWKTLRPYLEVATGNLSGVVAA